MIAQKRQFFMMVIAAVVVSAFVNSWITSLQARPEVKVIKGAADTLRIIDSIQDVKTTIRERFSEEDAAAEVAASLTPSEEAVAAEDEAAGLIDPASIDVEQPDEEAASIDPALIDDGLIQPAASESLTAAQCADGSCAVPLFSGQAASGTRRWVRSSSGWGNTSRRRSGGNASSGDGWWLGKRLGRPKPRGRR
jgi:hypothetical protein